jgi:general secretion pathway protein D
MRRTLPFLLLCSIAHAQVAKPSPGAGKPVTPDDDTASDEAPGQAEFGHCRKVPKGSFVRVTLKPESSLNDLVGWVSAMSCKRFVVPEGVGSRHVTVISPHEITLEAAYQLFVAALGSIGLSVMPSAGSLVIVESTRAKEGAPLLTTGSAGPGFVTRLLRVHHITPSEGVALLDKLHGKDATLTPHDASGWIIITDVADNVERMAQVLAMLDQPRNGDKVWLVKLRRTMASDMADKLALILGSDGASGTVAAPMPQPMGGFAAGGGSARGSAGGQRARGTMLPGGARIVPDPRTNSLIVVATNAAMQQIGDLVTQLEVARETDGKNGDGRVHVYALRNATADEIAQTLAAVTGLAVSVGGSGGDTRRAGMTGSTPGGAGGPVRPPTPPPGPGLPPGTGGGDPSALFDGPVRVAADRPTNTLVIVASTKDYLALKDILDQIDTPRRQVFIETTILEVSHEGTTALGVNFHRGGGVGQGGAWFGGSGAAATLDPNSALTSSTSGVSDLAQGLAVGVIGPALSVPLLGKSVPSFGVFLKMLMTSTDTNLLSAPHLLTADNEPAEFRVGQTVPMPGASVPVPTGTTLPAIAPSIEHVPVDLILNVTPHTSEGGLVRLDLNLELSEIAPSDGGAAAPLGPTTTHRKLNAVSVVRDGEPAVVGGLISDRKLAVEGKVPLLGDIPLIGFFFRQTKDQTEKRDLLVFITPHVIYHPNDLRRVYEEKMRERQEFLARSRARDPLRDAKPATWRSHGLLAEIDRAVREQDEDRRRYEDAAASQPPSPTIISDRAAAE